jgi:C1q domain-containing protein
MVATPTNAINVSSSGAVSFNGTAFTGGTLSIANGGSNATSFTQSNGIVAYNGTNLVNYAGPQLSSGGVMTNSTQPAFVAYCSANKSNVTGDGTQYIVVFDTTLKNVGASYNTSTGVFTAPVTGTYQFNTIIFSNLGGSAATDMIISFNGSVYSMRALQYSNLTAVTTTPACAATSMAFPMTAGDTMSVQFAAFGTTKTISVSGQPSVSNLAVVSTFSGFLIA